MRIRVTVVCVLAAALAAVLFGCGCLQPPAFLYPKNVVYGEVVDQNGQPVPYAEMRVSWHGSVPFPIGVGVGGGRLRADEKGQWQISTRPELQSSVSVRWERTAASAAAYDYLWEKGSVLGDLERSVTSPTNRVRFHLRKRGEGTFLLHDRRGGFRAGGPHFKLRAPADSRDVNLLRSDIVVETEEGRLKTPPPGYLPDLRITASAGATGQVCVLTFTMLPQDGSGIIVTNKLLFEAPASGYVAMASAKVPYMSQQGSRYAYVKKTTPPVYLRIKWELRWGRHCVSDGDPIHFEYETVLNPYGERNLEEEPEVTKARLAADSRPSAQAPSAMETLVSRLENEARNALDAGGLPEKPDMKRLIAEAEEKGRKK